MKARTAATTHRLLASCDSKEPFPLTPGSVNLRKLMIIQAPPDCKADEFWGVTDSLGLAQALALAYAEDAGLGNWLYEDSCPVGWMYLYEDDLILIKAKDGSFEIWHEPLD